MFLMVESFGFASDFEHKSSEIKRFTVHNTLNFLGLLLILYFAIDTSFDCDYNLCADKK